MSSPSYQSGKPGSVPDELKKLVEKGKAARKQFERDWFLNLAFYDGDQWCWWNHGRVERPDPRQLPPNRVMLVDNRINGIVRTEVAKLTKQRPIPLGVPNTADEEDINAAQLSEQVLTHLWGPEQLALERKLFAALLWARVCSAGFWKIFWDDTAGDSFDAAMDPSGGMMMDPRSGRPMGYSDLPGQLQGQAQRKTVHQGDVKVEVRSPFEVIPDPLAEGVDDAEWIIEEAVRSKEYLLKRYPDVKGIESIQEDATAVGGAVESRFSGAQTGAGYRGVRVFEYWARPSSQFPGGKRCVWTKDNLLVEEQQPFDCMPYVMFRGIDVPGRFWPSAVTSYLRGPQTELNKTKSQLAENRNRFGNPSLLKSKIANVRYTGVPGEVVEFDDNTQNAIPSFLNPPEMPTYVREEIDRAEQALREISGQHEVTSGQVPSGVTAASAINLLQEQDDTRLGPAVQQLETTVAEAGTKILELVARFYDDSRTLRISGEEGAWTIKDFRGSMLRGNTKIEVQAGSMMPRSQAARQASAHDLLTLLIQNGVPLDKRQLAKFIKDMQVGGDARFIEEYTRDETQINRENRLLSMGAQLPINSYDDNEAHIAGHEDWQKSAAYQQLSDIAHAAAEEHVRQHREQVQQAQMIAQQAQQPLPGMQQAPGQPPQGGPQ